MMNVEGETSYPRKENTVVVWIESSKPNHPPATEYPKEDQHRPHAIERPCLYKSLAVRHLGSIISLLHAIRDAAYVRFRTLPRCCELKAPDCTVFN